jgi:predicted DNA-binding protein YlxM (UPF0122 family)
MIEKITQITMLFDFYGELLTEKQKLILDLFYNEDCSLGEIGAEMGISRQAVHDAIKRSEQSLVTYEEKLGLVKKFMLEQERLARLSAVVTKAYETGDTGILVEAMAEINAIEEEERK